MAELIMALEEVVTAVDDDDNEDDDRSCAPEGEYPLGYPAVEGADNEYDDDDGWIPTTYPLIAL